MVLFVYDENKGGVLNMTPKQRSDFAEQKSVHNYFIDFIDSIDNCFLN